MKKKVLLYKYRIFLNARAFYNFIIEDEFKGEIPNNFTLNYVSVAFSKKLKTIVGIKVDWVTINLEKYDELQKSEIGWIKYHDGADETFLEFVKKKNKPFTKETLWRWVIDYVGLYDHPRSHMKRLTDDVLTLSWVTHKKDGVNIYELSI